MRQILVDHAPWNQAGKWAGLKVSLDETGSSRCAGKCCERIMVAALHQV